MEETDEIQLKAMQKERKRYEKFISRVAQGTEEDSFNASIAEKKDKIINYSAALNTSEEMIEAAVNQSSTLRENNTEKTSLTFHNHSSGFNSSILQKILPQ